ncbi:AMIN-like domain-containing (lipo)protein [Ornithinimicrobium tianjinense]|uniref:AMIN-like domain-containing protein n=1 Tax=Ornithinimicrobium tianjinense TaxID=1195761 RepID=A0A917BMY6_9MICO|nr:hypothetical protein [Ornithinimicrobium tianjinense]GGF49204.1 hypothetical protein GCM10011366_16390 [Ornithinimicrobium tianjinense]
MIDRHGATVPSRDEAADLADVREALERAASLHFDPDHDVHAHWTAGRRRRGRKRAGAALLAGAAGVAAVAAVWQSGLLGGATGPEPTVAAVPDGYTTFVFAAAGAGSVPDGSLADAGEPRVPTAGELDGTTWTLVDQLWEDDRSAGEIVGADPGSTELRFGDGQTVAGWGFVADDCGGGWFQEELSLAGDGRFAAGGLGTDDQGCPAAAQRSEDFWIDALGGGGFLRVVGDDEWLLVSVEAPALTADPAETTAPGTDEPTTPVPSTDEPSPDTSSDEPTSGGTSTDEPDTDAQLPGFTDPGEPVVSQGWPGGGGELFAPTVRAGRHDGFDRVVLDLTGTGTPTWRAAYPDEPLRDGSGLPAGVAGDSVLEVVVSGMAYPEPGDPVYDGGDFGLDTHTLGAVVEVIRTPPFEGQLQLFVGMSGERRPYRVFLLQDPARLVVDVETGG